MSFLGSKYPEVDPELCFKLHVKAWWKRWSRGITKLSRRSSPLEALQIYQISKLGSFHRVFSKSDTSPSRSATHTGLPSDPESDSRILLCCNFLPELDLSRGPEWMLTMPSLWLELFPLLLGYTNSERHH